jgi:hypothetical protein
MRSLLLPLVVAWFVVVQGCDGDRPPPLGIFDQDGGMLHFDSAVDGTINDLGLQTFDIIPIDIPARDVPPPDVQVMVGSGCESDEQCGFGLRCLQRRCAIDTCRTVESSCNSDSRCDMRCVPTRDLCDGIVCGGRETCFLGRCVAGCFAAPCAGVVCPDGQFCDDRSGACAMIRACTGACEDGYACHMACVPRSPCDGVVCTDGRVCDNGACVANPCTGVTCTNSICVAGRCVDTCACDPPCTRSPRDRCVVGACQCTTTCTPDSACGADDGCGGRCPGRCANRFSRCDPDTNTCVCTPSCAETAPCGSSDGCGGQCSGGCMPGFMCNLATSACDCTPHCPTAEEVANTACGTDVPNLCPGGQSCGTGTRCTGGLQCEMGRCVAPPDASPPDDGGGGGCSGGRSDCGGSCFNLQTDTNHCGTCDTVCPTGSTCTAGACVCPGGLTLCNGRCVNTQADQGNCGSCNNACPDLTACTAGVCACVNRCVTDPILVTCYQDIPNACPGGPSCGRGRLCPSGQSCSADARGCVCVPVCPPGVACGTSDNCGGQCAGTCLNGGGCARDPSNPNGYICSAAACAGGCPCGQVCRNNACVADVCPNGLPPCGCACCPVGQNCTGGSCQPIPP